MTGGTNVVVKEDNEHAGLRAVTLLMPPGNWVYFSPDQGRKHQGNPGVMSPLLARGHGYNHACDGVIVFFDERVLTLVYIELKSRKPHRDDYEKQFQSTRQFMRYVVGLLNEFHGTAFEIHPSDEHYIVLKLPTRGPSEKIQ